MVCSRRLQTPACSMRWQGWVVRVGLRCVLRLPCNFPLRTSSSNLIQFARFTCRKSRIWFFSVYRVFMVPFVKELTAPLHSFFAGYWPYYTPKHIDQNHITITIFSITIVIVVLLLLFWPCQQSTSDFARCLLSFWQWTEITLSCPELIWSFRSN